MTTPRPFFSMTTCSAPSRRADLSWTNLALLRYFRKSVRPVHPMAARTKVKHNEFAIGKSFWCGGREHRCTDIGTRTIAAICLEDTEITEHPLGSSEPPTIRSLSRSEAERIGWFNGPPYGVAERVFDEYDIGGAALRGPSGSTSSTDNRPMTRSTWPLPLSLVPYPDGYGERVGKTQL